MNVLGIDLRDTMIETPHCCSEGHMREIARGILSNCPYGDDAPEMTRLEWIAQSLVKVTDEQLYGNNPTT